MNKLKVFAKKYIKKDSFVYKIIYKIYRVLSDSKYKITNYSNESEKRKEYSKQVFSACNIISKYKNEKYIALYNPKWLGVANSTKGLFDNIVPLEQVFGNKNIKKVSNAIIGNNIKTVIFSQIVDGWIDIIKLLKKNNSDINIKVIWHANNFEVFSDYTWGLKKEVLELYDEKLIDCFAFVKKSMVEFYNKTGYKSFYLLNNTNIIDIGNKENVDDIRREKEADKIRIGLCNANSRELKNIYTQASAIKLLGNGIADIVPTYKGIEDFAEKINLEYVSVKDYIPTEDLLERIKNNEVNIYITFTECAPMFPLESFEVGVPCLVGNNNDYFQNTKLGRYVIVNKEDDAMYIKNKIVECITNKEKLIELYKEWKKDFDKECKELVKEFIEFNN